MGITCVVCGVDAGLRGAVLICATAQPAADLQSISSRGVSAGAGRDGGKKLNGFQIAALSSIEKIKNILLHQVNIKTLKML